MDHLDWSRFIKKPKWICGYSDVTVLHATLQEKMKIASIHGSMPINFTKNTPDALDSLYAALTGKPSQIEAEAHDLNQSGSCRGTLVGGNLSILYSLLGSEAQPDTSGKILFIEDLDEYLYHIDRMMMALKRAWMLDSIVGLVIGGMTDMNDNTIPFGKTAEEIISEHIPMGLPVAFGFPAGHLDDNRALVLGQNYHLKVTDAGSTLTPLDG